MKLEWKPSAGQQRAEGHQEGSVNRHRVIRPRQKHMLNSQFRPRQVGALSACPPEEPPPEDAVRGKALIKQHRLAVHKKATLQRVHKSRLVRLVCPGPGAVGI